MILKRRLESQLIQQINTFPVVVLTGARQVGKTTLAIEIEKKLPSIYLDLQKESDWVKLSDPIPFFQMHSDKLIILDEIQKRPRLFEVLRSVVDENRRKGKKAGQFLLLGSASMEVLSQVSESLTGRVCTVELCGLNMWEVDEVYQKPLLWFRGGFPENYLATSQEVCFEQLTNQIRTYLERDIPELGGRFSTRQLSSLWKMVAHYQGEKLNYSQLASNLEVDNKTVKSYVDNFEKLLLIRRLEPWSLNKKKTVIKSPRVYVRDSGILHCLLGIYRYDTLLEHPILGKSWEGFVVENICSILPYQMEAYYYRTRSGAEIDLLLQFPNGKLWAIEIKRSTVPKVERGFYEACKELEPAHRFVVYGGESGFPLKNDVKVYPLRDMMNLIQEELSNQMGSSDTQELF